MQHQKTFFFLLLFLISKVIAQKTIIYEDFFVDNRHLWMQHDSPLSFSLIDKGSLMLGNKKDGVEFTIKQGFYIDSKADFQLECDIKVLDASAKGYYGIIYGYLDNQNYYAFLLSPVGYCRHIEVKESKTKELAGWEEIETYHENGINNRIVIQKMGGNLIFKVNGIDVLYENFRNFYGMHCGFMVGDKIKISADNLLFKQDGAKINVVENSINGYKKENLGEKINSSFEELNPLISHDGKTLYICRKNHPENIGILHKDDIWYSQIDVNGTWKSLINIGKPINNIENNSTISITPDGNTMYIINKYKPDGSFGGAGISYSKKTAKGWSIPREVIIDGLKNEHYFANYTFSADMNYLIMSLDIVFEGEGEMDLYISNKITESRYSKPINLGKNVNTFASDFSPFLASDNTTLYYATSGKPGFGSADIFVTRRLDDSWTNWTEPKNLGPEVNAHSWDAYYTLPASGEYAYFVSYDFYGSGDIYRIKMAESSKPNPVLLVHGYVLDSKQRKPISSEIIYTDLENNKIAGIASSNPIDGSYEIILPYGKHYAFLAARDSFYSISDHIDSKNIKKYGEIRRDLLLAKIEKGQIIRLNNLFFDVDKCELKPSSYAELERLVEILQKYPDMKIEVMGHTDDDGTDIHNEKLSENRAQSVVKYLSTKIDLHRLTAKGYGESIPLLDNINEENKAVNRRVEFKIIEL